MPLQDIDFFGNLPSSPLDPSGTDSRTISDDQHRNIIASLSRQAPNWTGAITATHADLNTIQGLAAVGTKPMPGVAGQTTLFFYNNTVPPGYVLQLDSTIRQLVVGDFFDGGSIGGVTNPIDYTHLVSVSLASSSVGISGNVGGTAITTAQMPPHTHGGFRINTNCTTGNSRGTTQRCANELGATSNGGEPTSSSGGGASHDHSSGSLSGSVSNPSSSGTLQIRPRYASGVLGRLA